MKEIMNTIGIHEEIAETLINLGYGICVGLITLGSAPLLVYLSWIG